MRNNIKKVFNYEGFESLSDISRDMGELLEYPPFDKLGEYNGNLKITIEYLEGV